MGAFTYAAVDVRGKQSRGLIEADSQRQVRQILRDRGLVPLKVEAATARPESAQSAGSRLWRRSTGLSSAQLATLTAQLAVLLRAGMPLAEVLQAASGQSGPGRVRGLLAAVRSKVLEGHSLARAMAEFPAAFPDWYRATVAAGEQTGRLDAVMGRLAEYTEQSLDVVQRVRLALIYPTLLIIVAVAIVIGLMTFVVPEIVGVYQDQHQALPTMTRILIALSGWLANYGLLAALVLALGIVGLRTALVRNPAFRLRFDRRLLQVPIIGGLSMRLNAARFASTLAILVSSGVPLVDSLKISSAVLTNRAIRRQIADAAQVVEEGGSLSRALAGYNQFPPVMLYMIASGEASGELEQMLRRSAELQQREVDNSVKTLIGLLEPATLMIMGAVVLSIVLAILQPIMSLNQML